MTREIYREDATDAQKAVVQDTLYKAFQLAMEVKAMDYSVTDVLAFFESFFPEQLKYIGQEKQDEIILWMYRDTKDNDFLLSLSKQALVDMVLKSRN